MRRASKELIIMLRLLTIAALCAFAAGKAVNTHSDVSVCDKLVTLDGGFYIKEELAELSGFPADISVDWKTGNIFFTYVQYSLSMRLFVLRKGETKPKAIGGLGINGQSSAVDQTNGVVYLSNEKGIYTYEDSTNTAVPFAANKYDIMYLDTADRGKTIYFVQWEGHKVFKMSVIDKSHIELFDKIPNGHGLGIDGSGNFYYEVDKVAYMLKHGESAGVKIKNIAYNSVADYYIDKHDNVWIASDNGDLYKIDKANNSAKMVGNVGYNNINTIGFDKDDNIILGVEDALIKLEKVDVNPCDV